MSNDIKIKVPADLSAVNVNDLGELIWWSAHLSVEPEKLLSIINEVGASSDKVQRRIFERCLKVVCTEKAAGSLAKAGQFN